MHAYCICLMPFHDMHDMLMAAECRAQRSMSMPRTATFSQTQPEVPATFGGKWTGTPQKDRSASSPALIRTI